MSYSTGLAIGYISNTYPAVDQRKPTLLGNNLRLKPPLTMHFRVVP